MQDPQLAETVVNFSLPGISVDTYRTMRASQKRGSFQLGSIVLSLCSASTLPSSSVGQLRAMVGSCIVWGRVSGVFLTNKS